MDVQEQGVGNLMTITAETMFAPPETWTMAGAQFAYAAALPVPVAADVSNSEYMCKGYNSTHLPSLTV